MESLLPILEKMPSVLAFILIVLGSWAFEGWFFLKRENDIRLNYLENDKKKEKKIKELETKVDSLEQQGIEKDRKILSLEKDLMELKLLINRKFA